MDEVLNTIESIRYQSVGIIGTSPAGLIIGYTLLHDGFQNLQLLTRDKSVEGVWGKQRIYAGVSTNSVYRFSPLTMPPLLLRDQIWKNPLRDGGFGYSTSKQVTVLAGRSRSSIPGKVTGRCYRLV
ncbi:hypothetical protein L210DRAFT_3500387 [Boletus edulis BED1]|nr:hypothetical protein L210DRAFT_3500387 [Boletus edulis BED1]